MSSTSTTATAATTKTKTTATATKKTKTPGLFKRGDRWVVVVNLGIDPVTNKRRQRWETLPEGTTRREAEIERIKLLRQRDTGELVADPSQQKLADYLKHWLDTHVATSHRPKTLRVYRDVAALYLVPLLGILPLAKLTPAHLRQAYATLHTEGAPGGRGPLAAKSLALVHGVLHAALKQAVKWQAIGRNVAEAVDLPRPERHELAVWTVEEVRRFLDAAREALPPFGACLNLALLTGMRQSELVGLRWQDVDLERGSVQVLQTIQTIRGQGRVVGDPKTTSGRRRIALPALAVEVLRRHRAQQNEQRLRLGPAYQDNGLVFATFVGTALLAARLRAVFAQTVETAGLPPIRFHDLRHTHASLLLALNEHPKVVSERLGHSNTGITMNVYSHLLPGLQDAAANRLDALLRETPTRPLAVEC